MALYGTLKAALLFYRKLVSELKEHGFKINEYDPCDATKTVNGKQISITWHVDGLKISHMDREVVDHCKRIVSKLLVKIKWLANMCM